MDTNDYAAFFDADMDEGGKAQAFAGPAESAAEEGGKAQELAEPADRPAGDGGEEPAPQSAEENARFAAARRRAEQQAAVEAARREERERVRAEHDALLRRLGIKNPLAEGKTIESMDDLAAYERERAAERELAARRFQQMPQAGEPARDGLAGAAQEAAPAHRLEALAREAEARREEQIREEICRRLDADVREIAALDPDVKTVKDLARQETYPELVRLVGRGNSLYDAYRIVNYGKLSRLTAAAAEQAARNRAVGKSHLRPAGTRGTGAPAVSRETVEAYRAIDPDVTLEEIRRYEAKYQETRKKE